MHVSDKNFTSATFIGFNLVPGVNETGDDNLTLKSYFPEEVKFDITIDDIRLKSISITSKTVRLTKTSFFQYETWFYRIPLRTSKRLCRICSINSRTK